MTIQQSVAVRNAKLDAVETTIGASPLIKFFAGAAPANCAAADSGSSLANGTLPSDWAAAASAGSKAKSGTWTATGTAAAGAGTAIGHFRIYDNAGTTCHEQGTVTVTGGGGDMTVDNTSVANGQVITVNTYTRTAGNA
jgi:hypothetical protein